MKTFREFWDSFNTIHYEKVIEDKNSRINLRIEPTLKQEWKDSGGNSNVLRAFIRGYVSQRKLR
jgi:hypothetical protein